jgi:CheY-like chemotaxis protein
MKAQRTHPLRLWLLANERDISRILKRDLESSSLERRFSVDVFSDGESALSAFAHRQDDYYDLVLTDIRMSK